MLTSLCNLQRKGYFMARIIRPVWAIRCTNSGCKKLFEVAALPQGKQQEVVCPDCGEHFIYPPINGQREEQEN